LWLWRSVEVSCFSTTNAINTAKPCRAACDRIDYAKFVGNQMIWDLVTMRSCCNLIFDFSVLGPSWVFGRVQSINHPKCQRTRPWRWYSYSTRVWTRSTATEVNLQVNAFLLFIAARNLFLIYFSFSDCLEVTFQRNLRCDTLFKRFRSHRIVFVDDVWVVSVQRHNNKSFCDGFPDKGNSAHEVEVSKRETKHTF